MSTIEQNLQRVHQQIRTAAQDCGRDPQQITLLAVSKTKPVTAIEAAIAAGQRAFGENYVQEGVEKIGWFRERSEAPGLIWHFIGPLQSNKSRLVAENFDWCHTLDRPQLARRLNDQRPAQRAPLNVLIQINISGEATKAGIAPEHMLSLAALIAECPRLRLRGLMAILAPENDFQRQLAVFKRMYDLYEALQRVHSGVDTLSLGMTDDMPAAVAAGSTLVRIGTAIFGARE
ncbi:MAG: YggS family pyridoxal phosphate-dependent enzyme [Sodalis sp. (in: enterobacteria)]|uniref:YggS family pyridoxal phosphate-dependent enzyme n=1 Tax=Sodalis sp. (in: enterobacteria) TaxID=1898979 RepID=UPI0039E63C47